MSLWSRLVNVVRGDRLIREIDEELASHLEEAAAEGRDAAEARRALGRALQQREASRDIRRVAWLDDAWRDVRYAVHGWRQHPVFAVTAMLTLALGIGANTAIFALVDAALLRTLPVADPARLVVVESLDPHGEGDSSFSYPLFTALAERASAVADFVAFAPIALNLSAEGLTDVPSGMAVSNNYFSVLGVSPALGRGFAPDDDAVAVLSDRAWRARFQGDGAIVGRAITLNGLPFTVIGVAPRGFFGVEIGRNPDIFVPLAADDRLLPGAPRLPRPNNFWLDVVARLRPGVTAGEGAARTDAAYHQALVDEASLLRPAAINMLEARRLAFAPGASGENRLREPFGRPLVILMAGVALVLLIACANLTNLLLVRALARRREMAVRVAIGAGRGRLVRQLLTESLTLAAIGRTLGLVFGAWMARGLAGVLTRQPIDVPVDAHVLAFTSIATALTAILFGAAPVRQAWRTDLVSAFKGDQSGFGVRGRFPIRLDRGLVTSQVALAVIVLVGAGLFVRTLANLRSLDAGFDGDRVLLATIDPTLSRYTPERAQAMYAALVDRVAALPGVQSVSLADAPLLSGSYIDGPSIEGQQATAETSLRVVSPNFFDTMGIAIRRGRDFSSGDRAGAPKVAIINETIARQYFAGVDPIGRHVGLGNTPDLEVIGVIADTKYRNLRQAVPNTIYLPMEQAAGTPWTGSRTLHVRTAADPAALAAAVRDAVQALDRDLPVEIDRFSDVVDSTLISERLVAVLSGAFAGLALVLTAIGLYGVMAYGVARRAREIGIRMAIGANRAAVVRMVLGDSLWMVACGLAIGIPVSLGLSRLVTHQLFGIVPGDPSTVIFATAVLATAALAAAYVPARRAARVDPLIALRAD